MTSGVIEYNYHHQYRIAADKILQIVVHGAGSFPFKPGKFADCCLKVFEAFYYGSPDTHPGHHMMQNYPEHSYHCIPDKFSGHDKEHNLLEVWDYCMPGTFSDRCVEQMRCDGPGFAFPGHGEGNNSRRMRLRRSKSLQVRPVQL